MDNTDAYKFTAVLPSLNPDGKLLETVRGVIAEGFKDIIVVNDGSDADHLEPFTEAAKLSGVTVLTHDVNRGKGRALKTAMQWFLDNRKDSPGIVTLDGDGQHSPEDAQRCAARCLETGRTVLGVRDFKKENVPWKSRTGNNITKAVFRVLCRIRISDTQTGLRAFPASAIPYLVNYNGERYEYETDMLLEMKRDGLGFDEVTISTIYIDDNAASHFHPFRDSFRIYGVILKYFVINLGSFVKYVISSGICSIIDVALFALFNGLLTRFVPGLESRPVIMLATAGARIISSLCNYFLNRKAVFRSGDRASILRYYLLVAVQMVASGLLVTGINRLVAFIFATDGTNGAVRTLIKIVVDTALFFVNYRIQKAWVFGTPKAENNGEDNE